jgi:predicted N-formylglutamate amidohydrolase
MHEHLDVRVRDDLGYASLRIMPNHASTGLLEADEPAAFEVQGGERRSPFVIACDHAGRAVPRALGSLGLSQAELQSHVAWDIGAGGVARRLAAALGAVVVSQRYSRLVIDCNRPLDAVDSIATRSERVAITGNQNVGGEQAEARARAVFHPYHTAIRTELERRREAGRASIFVAVHSFTPVFLDVARPWHVGVLYNRDARLAAPLLRLLRDEGDLVVGCNQPYAVSDATDYSVVNHGEQRGIPHVELEIRQDLVADDAGQTAWAARLARLLVIAAQSI